MHEWRTKLIDERGLSLCLIYRSGRLFIGTCWLIRMRSRKGRKSLNHSSCSFHGAPSHQLTLHTLTHRSVDSSIKIRLENKYCATRYPMGLRRPSHPKKGWNGCRKQVNLLSFTFFWGKIVSHNAWCMRAWDFPGLKVRRLTLIISNLIRCTFPSRLEDESKKTTSSPPQHPIDLFTLFSPRFTRKLCELLD